MTEEELLKVIEQAARDGVTELDLSGKELSVLPPEIGLLTNLRSLKSLRGCLKSQNKGKKCHAERSNRVVKHPKIEVLLSTSLRSE